MVHSVQSFVETLRADGVEAGRKAAEEMRETAQRDAQRIVDEAEAKARKIIEDAQQEREQTLERTRTDLKLAARDTVARLRDTLGQAINRVLGKAVTDALEDADFLKELIREVVASYADADASEKQSAELNVSDAMQSKLCDWAISAMHRPAGDDKLSVELHGALTTAGFEYKMSDGTVEVTPESVVQVLSQIVTPELQELIAEGQQQNNA